MKPSSSSRKKTKDSDDDGKKKKQKKKKDPNAPKRAISAFMFFSQTEREVMEFIHSLFATFDPMLSLHSHESCHFLDAECEEE